MNCHFTVVFSARSPSLEVPGLSRAADRRCRGSFVSAHAVTQESVKLNNVRPPGPPGGLPGPAIKSRSSRRPMGLRSPTSISQNLISVISNPSPPSLRSDISRRDAEGIAACPLDGAFVVVFVKCVQCSWNELCVLISGLGLGGVVKNKSKNSG